MNKLIISFGIFALIIVAYFLLPAFRYYEAGFKSGMLPIDFYGKLVDQHGDIVPNAVIPYCTGGKFLASGKGCGNTRTDAQGRFEIHSEGGSLTLSTFSHPEIDFSFPKPKYGGTHSVQKGQMTFWGYQRMEGGNEPLWTEASEDNPYIFIAWRTGKFEKVIIGDANSHQKPDGTIYTMRLDKKRYKDRRVEGISDGHIRTSCRRGSIRNNRDWVDWQVTIEAINGGIQITDDSYLNLAPETGYQPTYSIDMRKNNENYKDSLINQRFYFRANNGETYGSLYIHIKPHFAKNKCIVNIDQYKINPNGSRNLAVRP